MTLRVFAKTGANARNGLAHQQARLGSGTVSRRTVLTGLAASASTLSACSVVGNVLPTGTKKSEGPGRAALLAPMSGSRPQLGQIMRNAATLGGNVVDPSAELSLFDSADTPQSAAAAAQSAIAAGARMIVGPLFGGQVAAVAAVVGSNVPILTLSNDTSVAGRNIFVLGVTPEQSAQSVLTFAARRGKNTVGVVVPEGSFGARSAAAAIAVGRATGQVILPAVTTTDPAIAITRLRAANNGALPKAVYLPSAGAELDVLAAALKGKTQILGSAQWSSRDPSNSAALRDAWYAAPDPFAFEPFAVAYQEAHGTSPGVLAGVAFDAVETARLLGRIQEQTISGLLRDKGFSGVIGPYRFERSGLCSRGLAILNVAAGSVTLIGSASA